MSKFRYSIWTNRKGKGKMNYIGIIGIYILVLAVIFVPTILNNKKRKKNLMI